MNWERAKRLEVVTTRDRDARKAGPRGRDSVPGDLNVDQGKFKRIARKHSDWSDFARKVAEQRFRISARQAEVLTRMDSQ